MDSCQLFQQIDTLADKIMTVFKKEVYSNPTSHPLWYIKGLRAFCWWRTCVSQTIRLSNYSTETKLLSLTNPIHSQIQFTHREFVKKTKLYFEAVELNDEKKQRFALLFNLNEDSFRLAESVEFGEGVDGYKNWIKKLKSLFERNQTSTEKR